MSNIEKLKKEVDDIKNSLNELKNNVSLSEVEKKKKAETLRIQVETTKQKIQNEIHSLKTKTDDESKKKKEEAATLSNSFSEIVNLYTSILNSTGNEEEMVETEKGFFGKAGERIGEQWSEVWSEDKRKQQPGKNLLRTTGFVATGVGAVALAYKGVKKIWNRAFGNGEKKQDQKEKKSEKGQTFRETGWGNFIKWLGIGSTAGGGIYGINKGLGGNEENGESTSTNTPSSNTATGNIDYSKVDTRGFTPGPYPFKHITTPYQGIEAYRVDNIRLNPLIGFNQLSLKGTEGDMITLNVKEESLHFDNKNAAGYKKNNPCNVSPFEGDIGRTGSSKVADGQNHSKYESMEDGLASFMRLMRQNRYRNKSIQGINCSGMQGVYSQNEPDSLKALRIIRITRICTNLQISPFTRINTDDKETMMAFTQQT